jgi:tripartite-type tricarboxylate transporter receptor subunit TctC
MTFPRRRFLKLIAGGVALPVIARTAGAQSWPSRVVRFVVGFPAGGGNDAVARIVANRLSEIWGQQVIVENKGGAGGNLAFETVARAAPDGYTMLVGFPGLVTNQFLYSSINYDPVADFAAISLIGTYGNLLVVPNSSPIKTFQDFLTRAKANPGKVTFASPGIGTSPHLAGELLKYKAHIDITHVPYRGVAAGGMSDLIAGRIDSMFNTTGSLLQAARAGQIRGIAVTSAERIPTAPEFPTMAESGVPGFDVTGWYALLAPARTPDDIIKRVNADLAMALGEAATRSRFDPLGVSVGASSAKELTALLRSDIELWGPLIKAANIKGE